jgi:NADH dehydrogenase FAD-containing subunit
MADGGRTRVLVLGGGFAGVGAARKLAKADAEVVLVDRHDYHTFQPLLYQLATGLLETTAVGHSLRESLLVSDVVSWSALYGAVGFSLQPRTASKARLTYRRGAL